MATKKLTDILPLTNKDGTATQYSLSRALDQQDFNDGIETDISANTTSIATNTASITVLQGRTLTAGTGLEGGGDLTADRSFDISDSGVVAATYGSATQVPQITLNAQGQATAASNVTIAGTESSRTLLASATLASVSSVDLTFDADGYDLVEVHIAGAHADTASTRLFLQVYIDSVLQSTAGNYHYMLHHYNSAGSFSNSSSQTATVVPIGQSTAAHGWTATGVGAGYVIWQFDNPEKRDTDGRNQGANITTEYRSTNGNSVTMNGGFSSQTPGELTGVRVGGLSTNISGVVKVYGVKGI